MINECQNEKNDLDLSELQTLIPTWDKPIEEQFVTTPVNHNTFFELVFQLKNVACAFLLFLLPQKLLGEINLPQLTVTVRHFRDEHFQESRADMVYEIPLKNSPKKHVKIYIVIEHKSYDDSHTMSQLLKYEQQIIDHEIALAKKEGRYTKEFKLPPIILVIFHHGVGIYTGSVELGDEFEQVAGTEDYKLNQKAILFDLSSLPKNELPHDPEVPELYVSLRIMQVIMSKNLDNILCEEDLFNELKPYSDKPEYRRFAHLFTLYVFDSNRYLSENGKQLFNQQIQKTFKGEIMLSPLAERYAAIGREQGIAIGKSSGRVEGRIEGRVEGKAEGRVEDILSILDVKFGEIFETVRESLYAITDNNRLQHLVRFAVKCESFEEFCEELKSAK
ncbi:MAG: Rpn family recombination-promoting nuclease/putative transposase [Planctomycetaceae bacterium]|jgi:predicted transposase YdaD|nr:Rpn family recombination-promoting nuclease/putative transposase [Planctomycetaceae bacterium]